MASSESKGYRDGDVKLSPAPNVPELNSAVKEASRMPTTSRRNIIKSFVTGGIVAGAAPVSAQHGQTHLPPGNAIATVVFGQWNTPVDRFTGTFTPANIGHHVSPRNVTIAALGSVAFLIGGFHLLLI